MQIKAINIKNFIGVEEFHYNPSKINILEGPKGAGKSSVLEAIETAMSNSKRRTEVIKHGTDEAVLLIETDSGLEVDRKLRTEKADYLKLRQQGDGIKSTEAELKKLLSGDIFRPLDFINMKATEQTEIILNMIKMDYLDNQIIGWFSEQEILSGINTDKHILQILKDIETKFYAIRTTINREADVLEAQVNGILKTLPDNYDGEIWRNKSVQEFYKKVSDAQEINNYIQKAKDLQLSYQEKLDAIESEKQNQIGKINLRYKETESDIKDIVDISKSKIEKSKSFIENADQQLENEFDKIENELQEEIRNLKIEYGKKKDLIKGEFDQYKKDEMENISLQNEKIASKNAELLGLDEKKQLEIEGVEKESIQKIETQKATIGKAAAYLEAHEVIDIQPLQKDAEEVERMRDHLREWDRMIYIKDGELAKKRTYSAQLTAIIEIARTKPADLLKQHECPLSGISVDDKGMIRRNGVLLDGLSDGEKLEVSFEIAMQRMGELRIMCLNNFDALNESEQIKILKLCEDNDIQAFVTITKDTKSGTFEIKNEL